MCQICGLRDLAIQIRWPKPLEPPIKDLDFLVSTAHDDYAANKAACARKEMIPASLLDVLRMIATSLEELERDREAWWAAAEKRALRKRLEGECDQQKLTSLHKVNNATSERIEAMEARLGTFVRWSLGLKGGVWELVHGDKVKQAGDSGPRDRDRDRDDEYA
ncbi:hypothetical protein LTR53_016330 [Teratosphaeriaceae sp. CCFEE 6253]|nr:hypothetical protein LTR53_016330 [Teratosphaeriaceae sp. CCFEE 6253]